MKFTKVTRLVFAAIAAVISVGMLAGATIIPGSRQGGEAQVPLISVDELILRMAKKRNSVVIIDVRNTDSYSEKIIGALQIPVDEVESRLKEIPRTREIVTYCACPAEQTSGVAAKTLLAKGYKNVRALKGGWEAWLRAVGQTESKK